MKWIVVGALAGALALVGCKSGNYSVASRVVRVQRDYTGPWTQFIQIGNVMTPIYHDGYYTKYIWVERPETVCVQISDLEPARVGDVYWIRRER